MKRCYNYELLWVCVFALLILTVSSLQPYRTECFAQPLSGDNLNDHSCVKLMKNSAILKNSYDRFGKDAKYIASVMEAGYSQNYMETDTNTQLKGVCVVPDEKLNSYNLNIEEDPIKGGPSQICKGQSIDNKIEVILPYSQEGVKGCALVFSDYGNDPKKIESVLNNLYYLSNETNMEAKKQNQATVNSARTTLQNTSGINQNIRRQQQSVKNQTTRVQRNISNYTPTVNESTRENRTLTERNRTLIDRARNSTW